MENSFNFGKTLKFIRKSFDYTQETVSRYLNIERQTYSHYETGRNLPSVEILYRLSNLYKIGVENFYLPLYDPRNDIAYHPEINSDAPSAITYPNIGEYEFSHKGENHVLISVSPEIAEIVSSLSTFSKSDLEKIQIEIEKLQKAPASK